MDPKDYVLQSFPTSEQQTLDTVLDAAAEAALTFVRQGLDTAMNRFNGTVEKT
jgi:PTH1 family peptidyl-tRNA hydrolase